MLTYGDMWRRMQDTDGDGIPDEEDEDADGIRDQEIDEKGMHADVC